MSKQFIQIIIQEKCVGDYRSFCICRYGDEKWELRGYGASVAAAAVDAYNRYMLSYESWNNCGYTIPEGVDVEAKLANALTILQEANRRVRSITDHIEEGIRKIDDYPEHHFDERSESNE